ncbi:exodeoxyribonuclease VII small subunit [Akkermansiaceae bacterium]|nr:exodeoxyribonuclease VII small subunit [Akkermansiaceae bacterium]
MSKKHTINFEESLSKLEQIVESMEDDNLPLEKMIEQYEEGIQAAKSCEEALKGAQKQLETIRNKNAKAQASPKAKAKEPVNLPDDEIRLF